jgi:hypothetical protein
MNKIKILNVKTGKISFITRQALEQLKKGGHFKQYEILDDHKILAPKVAAPVAAPVEVAPVAVSTEVELQDIEATEEIDETTTEEKRTYRKRKNS